jgi:hypothetical protein
MIASGQSPLPSLAIERLIEVGLFLRFCPRDHSLVLRKRPDIAGQLPIMGLFLPFSAVAIEVLRRASGPLLAMLAMGLFLRCRRSGSVASFM